MNFQEAIIVFGVAVGALTLGIYIGLALCDTGYEVGTLAHIRQDKLIFINKAELKHGDIIEVPEGATVVYIDKIISGKGAPPHAEPQKVWGIG